jgi:N-acetylglucosamine kinase-like BadF-type ATPase
VGRAGPCNHVAAEHGRAKLTAAVTGSIAQARESAGLGSSQVEFESACLGFSGGPADKEDIVRSFVRARRLSVTNDAWIALAGATAGAAGVVVIAGTGSIAVGRNGDRTARAGGWGYIFGDEGGGFDIARQAVRAALRREEGWGEPTVLHRDILAATGASDLNDLMHRMYTPEFPRPRIAALSALVDGAAQSGDAVARGILRQAAADLARIAAAVRDRLFGPDEPSVVSYVGGVFRSAILLDSFREQVQSQPPVHGPAAGALLEAYRASGETVLLSNVPGEKEPA